MAMAWNPAGISRFIGAAGLRYPNSWGIPVERYRATTEFMTKAHASDSGGENRLLIGGKQVCKSRSTEKCSMMIHDQ